jgi:DNA mismatch endonuclease, patch repair protein
MKANRSRDTGPERAVRQLLHAAGERYKVDWPLPFDRRRRADLAFTRWKVAVMIDGCFWHRCPEHYVPPKSHADFWDEKTRATRARDRDTDTRLTAMGWTVLRFWEHEQAPTVAAKVQAVLQRLAATDDRESDS